MANDFQERTQYFRATFPTFWSGETVEYLPVVSCEGRRAPDPATASTFPSSFRLSAASTALPATRSCRGAREPQAEFAARLEHLAHVGSSSPEQPELFGETPAGFVINWPPLSGTVEGPAFRATVIPGGEHQAVVRPDGIGILSVSVTLETHDRALIAVRYSGTVDFGENWDASAARSGTGLPSLPVRSQISMLTSEPRYRWLNRLALPRYRRGATTVSICTPTISTQSVERRELAVPKTVIVLGGGIGGMSAAHELIERGFSVRVFEQRDVPGWQGPQRGRPQHGSRTERRRRLPRPTHRSGAAGPPR